MVDNSDSPKKSLKFEMKRSSDKIHRSAKFKKKKKKNLGQLSLNIVHLIIYNMSNCI